MSGQFSHLIAAKVRAVFGPDALLTSVTTLAGDASTRRYHRVRLKGSGVPASLIVMELAAGSSLPLSSEELVIFKTPPKELPFLNLHRFLSHIGVRVPALYGHWEREGILLLEDVGDMPLWNRVRDLSPEAAEMWYQKAIDELLLLQVGGTEQLDRSCIAFQQRFDTRLYMWEFDHFLEFGLKRRPDIRVPPETVAALRKVFVEVALVLERQPTCLNHRDYHSWNLMIHEGAVVVIDFQDALLAPPQYDLASLLNDRETDSVIKPDMEARLIGYYRDARAAKLHQSISADEFNEIYLLSAVQRDLKVVGRFYYLDMVKGKPGYKQFIPPTLRRLKRNLGRLPQLEHTLPWLAEYYEEMR